MRRSNHAYLAYFQSCQMKKSIIHIASVLIALVIILPINCVKPFPPPKIKTEQTALVVNGVIRADSSTTINLTRTQGLADTTNSSFENDAQLFIEGRAGEKFNFSFDGQGKYHSENNSLSIGSEYRLKIITIGGREYASDYVEMKKTPEIDSIHWDQHDDIFFYVNTHDPTNKTKYYRWEFVETAEYHTAFDSHLDFLNDSLIFIEPEDYRYTCYQTYPSHNIQIFNTLDLSEDFVSNHQINRIPNDNSKTSVRYSILVKQFALTADAYNFWKTVRENSELTGGIFQPIATILRGNIHSLTDPDEVVLGYVSASTVTEKRIFIPNNKLEGRRDADYGAACKETFVYGDSVKYYLHRGYLPAYYLGGGVLAIAPNFCVDCRMAGGTTTKPDFW